MLDVGNIGMGQRTLFSATEVQLPVIALAQETCANSSNVLQAERILVCAKSISVNESLGGAGIRT